MAPFISRGREAAPGESADQVTAAAGRLEISERDLFFLAHCQWFGREPEAETLERAFAAYLFRREVPPWVRHYARETLALCSIGTAEARSLGLGRLPGPPPAPRHGRLIVAATGAAFLAFFVLLLGTGYDPGTSAPLTSDVWRPSCSGGGPGLAFVEKLAYAFADKTPPEC